MLFRLSLAGHSSTSMKYVHWCLLHPGIWQHTDLRCSQDSQESSGRKSDRLHGHCLHARRRIDATICCRTYGVYGICRYLHLKSHTIESTSLWIQLSLANMCPGIWLQGVGALASTSKHVLSSGQDLGQMYGHALHSLWRGPLAGSSSSLHLHSQLWLASRQHGLHRPRAGASKSCLAMPS